MDRKKELHQIIDSAHDELRKIEEAERRKKAKGLIGKFFKYENRYSSDETWWLYLYVTGANENGSASVIKFQKDTYGKIEFETDSYNPTFVDSFIEIDEHEFKAAHKEIMSELEGLAQSFPLHVANR